MRPRLLLSPASRWLSSLCRRSSGPASGEASLIGKRRPRIPLPIAGTGKDHRMLQAPFPSSLTRQQQHRPFAAAAAAQCCNHPEGCHHQPQPKKKNGEQTDLASTPCWACGKPTGCCNFFCVCGKIQPIIGHCSYFDTFHMPRVYDIDTKRLERSYWELQKSLHPDHYGTASRTEQDLSTDNSTYLNVAYRTLKDPTLRAKYLLQLEGINALDEKSKVADPKLLMEIMDLREQIEDATSSSEMHDLIRDNRQEMNQVKADLAVAYKKRDLPRMVELTTRLQYLSKVDYEARERLDRLESQEDASSSSSSATVRST